METIKYLFDRPLIEIIVALIICAVVGATAFGLIGYALSIINTLRKEADDFIKGRNISRKD